MFQIGAKVWAKAGNCRPWPAQVTEVLPDGCRVRFFKSKTPELVIPCNNLTEFITGKEKGTPTSGLKKARSAALKAMKEQTTKISKEPSMAEDEPNEEKEKLSSAEKEESDVEMETPLTADREANAKKKKLATREDQLSMAQVGISLGNELSTVVKVLPMAAEGELSTEALHMAAEGELSTKVLPMAAEGELSTEVLSPATEVELSMAAEGELSTVVEVLPIVLEEDELSTAVTAERDSAREEDEPENQNLPMEGGSNQRKKKLGRPYGTKPAKKGTLRTREYRERNRNVRFKCMETWTAEECACGKSYSQRNALVNHLGRSGVDRDRAIELGEAGRYIQN